MVVVVLCFAGLAVAGPSLPVTKPPVLSTNLLTGPPVDPPALQGQWFINITNGVETVRTNEFHDDPYGGLAGFNAITGYVDSITWPGGAGTPIVAFTITATIVNDTALGGEWSAGNNQHGELLSYAGVPYAGPMVDTKLAAEFAIADTNTLPVFNYPAGPYRDRQPYIEAINEDQWAWYCWNPADTNSEHRPFGRYSVPTWDFGTIPVGLSATRKMLFVVQGGGLLSGDARYTAIVQSFAMTNDILMNRSVSLKISTWIDEIALDGGGLHELEPPMRLSDVSVFHNREEEVGLDFGDAPDAPYQTVLASDGARHVVVPGIFMGTLIDAESDGQPTTNADGDDLSNIDDEDGVVFSGQFYVGQTNTAMVNCSTAGWLYVWIDYDANGSWGDFGEHQNQWATQGVNQVQIYIPTNAAIGNAYARFRFTTNSMASLNYTGLATDGEVEDYLIAIQEEEAFDFGDAPDGPYPTLLASNGARHLVPSAYWLGTNAPDAEPDGLQDPQALGDDNNNNDDEDLVAVKATLVQGSNKTISVVASTNGYLNIWVDHNQNGNWAGLGEQVVVDSLLVPGTNLVAWLTPSNALLGATFCRVRFCSYSNLSSTGAASDGEVEDYEVTINPAEGMLDYGDARDGPYPTRLASNGARHVVVPGVFLGASVDAEADGQPDGTATGDDNNPPAGPDDEDGVTLPATLYAGSTAQVSVVASVTGYLNAWLDWNADGDWSDVGEQVFVNQPLNPGINSLSVSVPLPPVLLAGGPLTRWRFTTNQVVLPGPFFVGAWTNGEVEDYEVQLESLDFGDAPDPSYPTLLANNGARHRTPSAYWLGGVAPDTEPNGLQDPQAMGDDNSNVDDEDLVAVAATLVRGSNKTISVTASTNGFLSIWVDYNADGDWADAGEQAVVDLALVPGANSVGWAPPSTAQLGSTFGRVRFSSVGGLSHTGLATDGEVEDYAITIYQPAPDTNYFAITNIAFAATTGMTIWWEGTNGVTYEMQYLVNLLDTVTPWTAWGSWVSGPPYSQTDTNTAATATYYRVVAPYSPPP
ncbi:MAG TPA: hypothetical protein DCM68_01055 [Verrucomicrobia bacterium]|nr:hypothetical protein [Verrucomicrobiota bacterium]